MACGPNVSSPLQVRLRDVLPMPSQSAAKARRLQDELAGHKASRIYVIDVILFSPVRIQNIPAVCMISMLEGISDSDGNIFMMQSGAGLLQILS